MNEPMFMTPYQARRFDDLKHGQAIRLCVRRRKQYADDKALLAHIKSTMPERIKWMGRGGRGFRKSPWHNPFREGPDGNRAFVVESFKLYLDRKRSLQARLHELQGFALACWCAPDEQCHCDVLLEALASKT